MPPPKREKLVSVTSADEPDWRLIAESMPQIVWVGSADGTPQYFNQAGVTYTGLTEPTYADWALLIHPEDIGRVGSGWAQAVRTGEPSESEYRVRRVDGQYRWLALRSRPVLDDDGAVRWWIVSATDVDERATERSQAEAFESAVMSQVADGVYTVDHDGLLVYMNHAASRMLGWTEDELRGRCMHDVIHFQRVDGTPVSRDERALLEGGTEGRLVRAVGEAFTRKDGSIFPVAYSSVPLGVTPDASGVAVVFRDISAPAAEQNAIRLLIVAAHALTSEAFQLLLSTQEGVEVVGSASTSAAALAQAARLEPDVVLMDYVLPDRDGVATAGAIRATVPGASVIIINETYDEAVVAAAIAAGCAGVLDKDRAWVDLVGAVRAAYYGQTALSPADLQRVIPGLRETQARARISFLTDREREVLDCIREGLSNRAIGERLGVSANTVRNHVQRVLYKLDVHSKLEALVVANQELPAQGA